MGVLCFESLGYFTIIFHYVRRSLALITLSTGRHFRSSSFFLLFSERVSALFNLHCAFPVEAVLPWWSFKDWCWYEDFWNHVSVAWDISFGENVKRWAEAFACTAAFSCTSTTMICLCVRSAVTVGAAITRVCCECAEHTSKSVWLWGNNLHPPFWPSNKRLYRLQLLAMLHMQQMGLALHARTPFHYGTERTCWRSQMELSVCCFCIIFFLKMSALSVAWRIWHDIVMC